MKTADRAALFILGASLLVLPWYGVLPAMGLVRLLSGRPSYLRSAAIVGVMHVLYLLLGHGGTADPALARLDEMLWLGHAPSVGATGSEFFNFAYFAFLPFIYAAIILGLAFRPEPEREEFLSGLSLTYCAGLSCHILFPAHGPLGGPPAAGPFGRIVAWCVAFEGGPHSAFPSLHAAASAYVYLFERRRNPARAAVYFPIVSLIVVSTVVLRYHYVADLLAAIAIAAAAQKGFLFRLAASAVKASGLVVRRRFLADLQDPEAAQRRVLGRLTGRLAATRYGRALGASAADSYEEFKSKVPIVRYDDLLPWIERQKTREDDSLAAERVLFYEKTSGSTAASKYIPYTASLRRSFHHMFFLWLHDLLLNGPKLETGRTFLGVSPCSRSETETGRGVKVGVESDVDYVGGWLGILLKPFLARELDDGVEAISVWSPTFLRGRALPRSLKLLSCWDRAHAQSAAAELRGRLPGVMVQGKGLLSTEAPVTIPWIAAGGCVPVLDEVFFEFEDARGSLRLLHELEPGGEYSVIVTQAGGLARYRTGDLVKATHFYQKTPCLEFLGRADEVCDLVGEKLSAGFVAGVLSRLGEGRFRKLAPAQSKDRYVLLVDEAASDLAARLDALLQESVQYKNARLLGQLSAPEVVARADIQDRVDAWYASRGIRRGTVKDGPLLRQPGLAESLC